MFWTYKLELINLKLGTMRDLIIIILCLFTISACCKKDKTFYDEDVSANGWTLFSIQDDMGNILIEKPDDLPKEIYFVFNTDLKIIGNIASFSITEGYYSIEENNTFSMNLATPFLPICCEWDEYFLANYKTISEYEYDGANLILYFGEARNQMIFIKS